MRTPNKPAVASPPFVYFVSLCEIPFRPINQRSRTLPEFINPNTHSRPDGLRKRTAAARLGVPEYIESREKPPVR